MSSTPYAPNEEERFTNRSQNLEDESRIGHSRLSLPLTTPTEIANEIHTQPLYPSRSQVERTFRFLEDYDAQGFHRSSPNFSRSEKKFSTTDRVGKDSSSTHENNENVGNGPLDKLLHTGEKSTYSLQQRGSLFPEANLSSSSLEGNMCYPLLTRSATDHLETKNTIFDPEFSRDTLQRNHTLSFPHTHATHGSESSQVINFDNHYRESLFPSVDFKLEKNEILFSDEKDRPQNSQLHHNREKKAIQGSEFVISNRRSQPNAAENKPESPEGKGNLYQEINEGIKHRPLSDSVLYERENRISSSDGILIEKLSRSVSDNINKNFGQKHPKGRRKHTTKNNIDPKEWQKYYGTQNSHGNSVLSKPRKRRNTIVCLGCNRSLTGNKNARFVSCPVCRVVTPNKV